MRYTGDGSLSFRSPTALAALVQLATQHMSPGSEQGLARRLGRRALPRRGTAARSGGSRGEERRRRRGRLRRSWGYIALSRNGEGADSAERRAPDDRLTLPTSG
jgi:hypothetical protein